MFFLMVFRFFLFFIIIVILKNKIWGFLGFTFKVSLLCFGDLGHMPLPYYGLDKGSVCSFRLWISFGKV